MKKMKYIFTAIIALGITFSACDDFLDVNDDPNNPSSVPVTSSLPVVLFYGSQLVYDHTDYGMYMAQAFTTAGKSQSGSYAYRSGWDFMVMNRHPQWRRHFYDIGSNVNGLLSQTAGQKNKNYELVARTIRLMSTLYTTDMFGPMPLSEAYKSNTPKYDDQADIYAWMYTEVDELLEHYNDPKWAEAIENVGMSDKIDRIYGGDMNKWKSFTYALKARIYLRKLPNWDPSAANCKIIIDACDEALKNWTEPRYNYPGGSSPEQNCPWGTAQPKVNAWESFESQLDKAIPTKFLLVNMMGVNEEGTRVVDPRVPFLMKRRTGPAGSTDDGLKYRFLESNIGIASNYTVTNYPNLFFTDNKDAAGNDIAGVFTQNNSYIALMLTEELYLMKAEALYWNGQKDDARQTTIDAVTINLKRHGVSAFAQTQFLKNSTYFPSASDFNIGHVMRHKYVCMYLQPEIWNDMRRYKYSNNINNVKYDGATIYPGLRRPYNLLKSVWSGNEDWVQRVNYDPETEPVYNRLELIRLGAFEDPNWMKKPLIWAE